MPKYTFHLWEEIKWAITFEAKDLQHAKELAQKNLEDVANADDLPNAERYFLKGDEKWDLARLEEEKEN